MHTHRWIVLLQLFPSSFFSEKYTVTRNCGFYNIYLQQFCLTHTHSVWKKSNITLIDFFFKSFVKNSPTQWFQSQSTYLDDGIKCVFYVFVFSNLMFIFLYFQNYLDTHIEFKKWKKNSLPPRNVNKKRAQKKITHWDLKRSDCYFFCFVELQRVFGVFFYIFVF